MFRQYLAHGPTGKVGPRLFQIGDLIPQFIVLAIVVLPAARNFRHAWIIVAG